MFHSNPSLLLYPVSLRASPVRVRVQGNRDRPSGCLTEALAGVVSLSASLEAPLPTALFSSFPTGVGKVNTFRGRSSWRDVCETGLWLSASSRTLAKQLQGASERRNDTGNVFKRLQPFTALIIRQIFAADFFQITHTIGFKSRWC